MSAEGKPLTEPALLARPLTWITRQVLRLPMAVLALAAVLTGVSLILTATRLGFRTSRLDLLNPQSGCNQLWIEYINEFGDADDVVRALIETESGVILDIDINQATAHAMPRWHVAGQHGSLVFDDEEQARQPVIKALNAREMATGSVVSEERVMITFPDETRNQQIGGKKGKKVLLGTMAKVDAERVQFLWSGEKLDITQEQAQQLFFKGSDVHLKFQVKLIKKGYFELDAVIQESQPATDDKVRVVAAFKKISENEAAALSQFAQDMDFLKRQLPGV